MTKLYIGQFEFGKPYLASADFIKETEANYIIQKGTKKCIINDMSYLPNRLSKNVYFCSITSAIVLDWLIEMSANYLVKLNKNANEIAGDIERLSKLKNSS